MRIIIATVQVPFVSGGAEAHALGLNAALLAAGHEVEIVTFPFNAANPERIPEQMLACQMLDLTEFHGRPVDRLIALKFPAYLIAHPHKLVWLLHQHRAAYDLWSYPFEDLDASPQGSIVRAAIHRGDQSLKEAKRLFANSANVARRLSNFCAIDSTPLYHPPPGADEFYCADEVGDYFFFPSRLSATKRQALVIEALAATRHAVKVKFAGVADSAEYGQRLRHLAEPAGVASRVEWLGQITDAAKRENYARALAVLFPPLDEDYGYVTLEAMLSSKAVITCDDSGGPLEFVLPEQTGVISQPTAAGLAVAMDQLWEQRDLAAEYGRAGRRRYEELGLSWENVVRQLLS